MTRKDRFIKARSYVTYYGREQSEKLSRYDVAVIEPLGHDSQSLEAIKKSGTLLVGYVSVMEIHPDFPEVSLLKEDDFIWVEGKPLKNSAFGTYVLNICSSNWSKILLGRISQLIEEEKYDGVFLDTIGDIESHEIPFNIRNKIFHRAIQLVEKIREKFPESLIIQNNGLEQLCQHTAPNLDGICWENPPLFQREGKAWVKRMVEKLVEMKKQYRLQILLLFEEPEAEKQKQQLIKKIKNIKKRHDFLTYIAFKNYITEINEGQEK